jgi:hypothetical protein
VPCVACRANREVDTAGTGTVAKIVVFAESFMNARGVAPHPTAVGVLNPHGGRPTSCNRRNQSPPYASRKPR